MFFCRLDRIKSRHPFLCKVRDGCIKTCWERWRSYSSLHGVEIFSGVERKADPLKLA